MKTKTRAQAQAVQKAKDYAAIALSALKDAAEPSLVNRLSGIIQQLNLTIEGK